MKKWVGTLGPPLPPKYFKYLPPARRDLFLQRHYMMGSRIRASHALCATSTPENGTQPHKHGKSREKENNHKKGFWTGAAFPIINWRSLRLDRLNKTEGTNETPKGPQKENAKRQKAITKHNVEVRTKLFKKNHSETHIQSRSSRQCRRKAQSDLLSGTRSLVA